MTDQKKPQTGQATQVDPKTGNKVTPVKRKLFPGQKDKRADPTK